MILRVKAIRQCECGAEIKVFRKLGPRDKCKPCLQKLRMARFLRSNPNNNTEHSRAWRLANPGKNKEVQSAWQRRNLDAVAAKCKIWRDKNPEKAKATMAKYRAANKEKINVARSARRHSCRTPKWADKAAILKIYKQARELSVATGIEHQVDHILPLKGRLVSGLHVENNLQILTAFENRRKQNKVIKEYL